MARLQAARWRRLQGVKFFMQAGQDVTVGGRLEQAQYQYTLTDTDAAELNHWAPILLQQMQGLQQLTDVASDQQIASPALPSRSIATRRTGWACRWA